MFKHAVALTLGDDVGPKDRADGAGGTVPQAALQGADRGGGGRAEDAVRGHGRAGRCPAAPAGSAGSEAASPPRRCRLPPENGRGYICRAKVW